MLAIDPALGNLSALAPNVEWMNGLQFYLHRDLPIAHGHVVHIDSEWALSSVSQVQFWRSLPPDQFGNTDVRGVLSVDISDWDALVLNGRSATQCSSREEVNAPVWGAAQAIDQSASANCCATTTCTRGILDPGHSAQRSMPIRGS